MSLQAKLTVLAAAAALSTTAEAQFNNEWIEFRQDSARIRDAAGAPAGYITGDVQEKDYAWGDLDQDGWTDLVVVRKQPATTHGAFPNFLLMNEGGLLVDRSAQYASATDVAGDNGFLTPTNDRDVAVVDVDLDGWLDVVTSTALGGSNPKHITHPRVYVNLGDDAAGNWLGLRFENARIPTMTPQPTFCAVAFGDVTGDGSPDLYFADYGSLDDRLLVNDGNGFFTDTGTSRMSAGMLSSSFGSSARIIDMNGDGANDVVKGQNGSSSIAYNNPANVGFFNLFDPNVGVGAPYHTDAGDLNNDGRPDIVMSNDGADNYRYNTGNDPLGRAILGASKTYSFLTGGDDGFAGNLIIVDLDGDGWNDTIHSDFDVDVFDCGRRSKIYHNPGGTPGQQVTLKEEAESSLSSSWRGAKGMVANDFKGTFDVAVFDIDNDDDLDLVYGRCAGTFVWMNQQNSCSSTHYAFGEAVANSTGQPASISSNGDASLTSNALVLSASGMPANKTGLFLFGTTRLWSPLPFGNGLRFIGGAIQRLPVTTTDANGEVSFAADMTTFPLNGIAAGDVRDFQFWYRDPAAGGAFYNATDALEIPFCP